MQQWWYYLLRFYVRIGLHFYFKRIIIRGKENIPKGPVIFASNHQNAFMDALLIVCFNSHFTHFLARADIFRKPFYGWVLSTLNMIPIYRIRDGWQSLTENHKTFDACYRIFARSEAVVIFPEGNHGSQRRVRSLSKGFSRIAFEALKKDPGLTISLVPVGLNYSDHRAFRGSVSIYFGHPISVNEYFNEPLPVQAGRLRDDLSASLKLLTTHVENVQEYHSVIQKLKHTHVDFLNPAEINLKISQIENGESLQTISATNAIKPFHYVALILNFIPLILWNKIMQGIKDPVFITSLKFGFGIFAFPFFYLFVGALIYPFAGAIPVFAWLIISFPSMLFLRNTPSE